MKKNQQIIKEKNLVCVVCGSIWSEKIQYRNIKGVKKTITVRKPLGYWHFCGIAHAVEICKNCEKEKRSDFITLYKKKMKVMKKKIVSTDLSYLR